MTNPNQASADGKQRIDSLTVAIEYLVPGNAQLNTDSGNLDKNVLTNPRTLDQAIALRNKNDTDFVADEKGLLHIIGSVKAVIVAPSKHDKGMAPLQKDNDESLDLVSKVGHVMRNWSDTYGDKICRYQCEILKVFVPQGVRYAPQPGEILWIMHAMRETFETKPATPRNTEASEFEWFTNLSTDKTDEIQGGQDQTDAKDS